MRLPLSFLAACLMAVGLFGLMLYMVAPPVSQPSDEPISVANFVRMDGNASETASRTRQQAPQPPQPQTPQTPTPPTPMAASPTTPTPTPTTTMPPLIGPGTKACWMAEETGTQPEPTCNTAGRRIAKPVG